MLSESLQHFLDVLQVVLEVLSQDDDVIQIGQYFIPSQSSEHKHHSTLEGSWCIVQTKSHPLIFKQSILGDESSLCF